MAGSLLSLAEAAERLNVKPGTIRTAKWAADHGLPSRPLPPITKIGSRLYVDPDDLQKFIDEHTRTPGNGGDPEKTGEILPRALEEVATQIERLHPEQAKRLRALARGVVLRVVEGGQDASR